AGVVTSVPIWVTPDGLDEPDVDFDVLPHAAAIAAIVGTVSPRAAPRRNRSDRDRPSRVSSSYRWKRSSVIVLPRPRDWWLAGVVGAHHQARDAADVVGHRPLRRLGLPRLD